jgi:hypothetical protein
VPCFASKLRALAVSLVIISTTACSLMMQLILHIYIYVCMYAYIYIGVEAGKLIIMGAHLIDGVIVSA